MRTNGKKIKRCLSDDGYWKRKPCNKDCLYYDTCIYTNNEQKATEKLLELQVQEKELRETNRHDIGELQIMQSYSLERKIQLTCERIKAWYEWWDGNVYMSFSGGKDSTVLLDLVRNVCGLKDVPAVFVDTGLEYPEIRDFVKSFDNVEWLKPKMNFKQVIQKYGYPFFTKKISGIVFNARNYLRKIAESEHEDITNVDLLSLAKEKDKWEMPYRVAVLLGVYEKNWNKKKKGIIPKNNEYSISSFNQTKYQFMLNAPFNISSQCCNVMKKAPMHKYSKSTGRKPMTAQMAQESNLREHNWLENGCNGFYMSEPISNPMAFWTEQDVLKYIKNKNIPICSVYGDVVEDLSGTDEVEGQMTLSECGYINDHFDAPRPKLKTTGCDRTGCMFCGYGCHLEKEGEGRFERMKETHPKQYEYIMKPTSEGGLGYKEIIDWINEHGNMHIRY